MWLSYKHRKQIKTYLCSKRFLNYEKRRKELHLCVSLMIAGKGRQKKTQQQFSFLLSLTVNKVKEEILSQSEIIINWLTSTAVCHFLAISLLSEDRNLSFHKTSLIWPWKRCLNILRFSHFPLHRFLSASYWPAHISFRLTHLPSSLSSITDLLRINFIGKHEKTIIFRFLPVNRELIAWKMPSLAPFYISRMECSCNLLQPNFYTRQSAEQDMVKSLIPEFHPSSYCTDLSFFIGKSPWTKLARARCKLIYPANAKEN